MKKKMSKFNIVAKTAIYFIIILLGAMIGYLLDGDLIAIGLLCFGTGFLVSVIEEDLMTR